MEGFRYEYQHCGEDVVVLAGDIHTRNRHKEIIDRIPHTVQILMVPGNHEYYGGVYEYVNEFLRNLEEEYPNFRFLDKQHHTLGDVDFFGGMMCTDFFLHGEADRVLAELAAHRGINDFRVSSKIDGLWTVEDHKKEFEEFTRRLKLWLRVTEGRKRVVISHFVPHEQVIHPRWRNRSNLLNPYFTVDMDAYMGWEGLWLFGHTHDSADVMIGETRVVGNPKGYGSENPSFNNQLILEI